MEQLESGSFISGRDAADPPDFIRIVSWNINRGQRLNEIIGFLGSAPADLILLQETDLNARRTQYCNIAREVAQALAADYVFGYEFEELTQGTRSSPAYHGQATLSRWPLSESRVLRFRNQSKFWHPRWFVPRLAPFQRRSGGRMALVTHASISGKRLILYNVHLESRGDDSLRCRQLSEILDDAGQYGTQLPVLLAGDFNLDVSDEVPARIVSGVQFHNPFGNGRALATTSTSHFGRARRIDWILTRGLVCPVKSELHDDIHGSDHYPLSITLRWT